MTQVLIDAKPLRPFLKTTYDVADLLDTLRMLQNNIFHKQTTLVRSLDETIPHPLSTAVKKIAQEQKVDIQSPTEGENFLNYLQETIKNIPVLHLTISINPTMQLINQINDWLLLQMPNHVILDITTDRSLIGGAQISFNGKYKDYSLKKQIEELKIIKTKS